MVTIFRELRRVLKSDGSLWLNLGDSYAGSGKGQSKKGCNDSKRKRIDGLKLARHGYKDGRANRNQRLRNGLIDGLKAKNLIGIPWRVALALQDDGWFLRQDIIWQKPNAMPESVRDRCTKAHEYIFLLTKSPKYYYDADAIKEPHKWATVGGYRKGSNSKNGGSPESPVRGRGNSTGSFRAFGKGGRNKRSVWTVSTRPFKEAHFAVFPPDLIRPCILAGCSKGGLVIDPFMGAGTTAVVAKQECRNFIGFELNPEYIKIAKRRISLETIMPSQK